MYNIYIYIYIYFYLHTHTYIHIHQPEFQNIGMAMYIQSDCLSYIKNKSPLFLVVCDHSKVGLVG